MKNYLYQPSVNQTQINSQKKNSSNTLHSNLKSLRTIRVSRKDKSKNFIKNIQAGSSPQSARLLRKKLRWMRREAFKEFVYYSRQMEQKLTSCLTRDFVSSTLLKRWIALGQRKVEHQSWLTPLALPSNSNKTQVSALHLSQIRQRLLEQTNFYNETNNSWIISGVNSSSPQLSSQLLSRPINTKIQLIQQSRIKRQKEKQRRRLRVPRSEIQGMFFVRALRNSTTVTLSDNRGLVKGWKSAAAEVPDRPKTSFAAKTCGIKIARLALRHRMKNMIIRVQGFGPGRRACFKGIKSLPIKIWRLEDVTRVPHNGCRQPKAKSGRSRRINRSQLRLTKLTRTSSQKFSSIPKFV